MVVRRWSFVSGRYSFVVLCFCHSLFVVLRCQSCRCPVVNSCGCPVDLIIVVVLVVVIIIIIIIIIMSFRMIGLSFSCSILHQNLLGPVPSGRKLTLIKLTSCGNFKQLAHLKPPPPPPPKKFMWVFLLYSFPGNSGYPQRGVERGGQP